MTACGGPLGKRCAKVPLDKRHPQELTLRASRPEAYTFMWHYWSAGSDSAWVLDGL